MALSAAKRQQAEQGMFDFTLPWGKKTLNTREVAAAIGREQDFVRALVDAGRLEAHRDSALGERKSSIITRRSVLLYLAETADYDPADFFKRLGGLFDELTREELLALQADLTKRIARLS